MAVSVLLAFSLRPGPAAADHLFSVASGFEQARNGRESLRVCAPADIDSEGVIAPWNGLAGWELFVLSCDAPDITFSPAAATWVEADYERPFTRCRIHYSTASTMIQRHEIGHCLGFADHVRPWEQGPDKWVGEKPCGDYAGVMSYCTWNEQHWFGDDDFLMLAEAGYGRSWSFEHH